MAIRAIWGFNHLPQGDIVGATGFGGTKLTGFGIAYNNYGLVYGNTIPLVTASYGCILNNELTFVVNGGGGSGALYFFVSVNAARLTDGVSPKSVIGFRFTPGKQLSTLNMMTIGGFAITPFDFGITPLAAASFVEIVIDRVNKKLSFFNNGVFKSTKIFTTATYAPGGIVQFMNSTAAVGASRSFSKFYFLDDTEDDSPCTRLGAIDFNVLPVATAVTNDWVSSGGSVVNALNSQVNDVTSLPAPVVTSPPTMAPISVKFASIPNGDKYTKIYAVDILTITKRNESAGIHFAATMSLAGSTLTSDDVHFANKSFRYSDGPGVQLKAPNNVLWNTDRLAGMTYTIQPKAGA